MNKRMEQTLSSSLEPRAVVDFLETHQDFFQQNEDLLEKLSIPHPNTGEAISLLERLIQRQREQHQQLQEQMSMLLKAARDNERLVMSLHHLTLEVLRCDSTAGMVETCCQVLKEEFSADEVTFNLIGYGDSQEGLYYVAPDGEAMQVLDSLFEKREPICGRLSPKQQASLFGERGGAVKSAVLIPLFDEGDIGVLALGSEDEARFYPGMGTLFINQLGSLLSRALVRYQDVVLLQVASGDE